MWAKLEEFRTEPTRVQDGESVVVLARAHLDGIRTEAGFLSCITRRLTDANLVVAPEPASPLAGDDMGRAVTRPATLKLYPGQGFVDSLYPWLEPSTVPTDLNALRTLLARPGVSDRVRSLGVRYVVWVDGATRKGGSGGNLACGISPGGAGCFGFGWWESESHYEAAIWDLHAGVGAGGVVTDVKGTSVVFGVGVPVPLIAPVRYTACSRLSDQLKAFLAGGTYQ